MQGYNPTIFQQVIFQLLSTDIALIPLVEGIYSHVPEHTEFPYLLLSIESVRPYNTSSSTGSEIEYSVNCFNQMPGQAEIYAILEKAYETLHDSQPSIGGYNMVNNRFINFQYEVLNDGVTSKGSMFFRSVIEKI